MSAEENLQFWVPENCCLSHYNTISSSLTALRTFTVRLIPFDEAYASNSLLRIHSLMPSYGLLKHISLLFESIHMALLLGLFAITRVCRVGMCLARTGDGGLGRGDCAESALGQHSTAVVPSEELLQIFENGTHNSLPSLDGRRELGQQVPIDSVITAIFGEIDRPDLIDRHCMDQTLQTRRRRGITHEKGALTSIPAGDRPDRHVVLIAG